MEARQAVAQALRSFETAMMVTLTQSGPFDVRPMHMAAIEVDQGGPIWFLTSIESHTAMELAGDKRTLLVFQDSAGRHLAVWGTARVIQDPEHVQRLWREPLGPHPVIGTHSRAEGQGLY
jgi:general stress protein 26